MKKFGIAAVAALVALVLGSALVSNAPNANADTTSVVNVHCILIAAAIDGDTTNTTTAADYEDACGDPTNAANPLTETVLGTVATAIGDEDGTFEASDLDSFEGYDGNQLQESCTSVAFLCTNLFFVFVDDEGPVTLDTPSGLTSQEAGDPAGSAPYTETDAICETDGDGGLGTDDDCSDTIASNGDGVVVFHVVNFNAGRGDTKNVEVLQEAVAQNLDVNVVGTPNDVVLTLVEETIETSGSVSGANACAQTVDVTDAIDPAFSTLAFAQVFDEDDRLLTMVPTTISVQPPGDDPDIATLGQGDDVEEVTGNTSVTIDTGIEGAPIGHYIVICGGSGTGVTDIKAQIDDGDADLTVDDDTSTVELTVIGAPASATLAAVPSTIKCDGSETSTVTVTVTDSEGNALVAGVPVNFTVVALGTANPINTVTDENGQASSVITPLSNSSAGVTVIVTAGSSSIATPVQTSTRVDCALPLDTQPTLTPPGGGGGPISPPDSGNGGYLGQDSGSNAGLLIALAAVAGTVVFAGGLVARRAGK